MKQGYNWNLMWYDDDKLISKPPKTENKVVESVELPKSLDKMINEGIYLEGNFLFRQWTGR